MILFQFYQFVFIAIVLGAGCTVLSSEVDANLNEPSFDAIPSSFDWRTKGVISPVQDYNGYSFVNGAVLVETIETLHAIATGNLTRGSVERVKDCCAKSEVLSDCIQKLGGICTYDDYPTARNVCEPNACKPFTSFERIDHYQEQNDSVLLPLILNGTLFVGIDASLRSFSFYENGVYKEKNCSQTLDTTALQIVGYGSTEDGEQYWIAKNSWGEEWGESGYIRILRGENICGIGSQVYQPLISIISTTTTTLAPVTTTTALPITTTTGSGANELYFSLNKFLFFIVLFSAVFH